MLDPTRRYLAVVYDDSVVLWDLQVKLQKMRLDKPIDYSPWSQIAFNPDGSLLAIGRQDQWQIWSVEDQKLLATHPEGAYAVTFSPDGRLFIWGDTEGVIHVLGVTDNESSG